MLLEYLISHIYEMLASRRVATTFLLAASASAPSGQERVRAMEVSISYSYWRAGSRDEGAGSREQVEWETNSYDAVVTSRVC